MLLFLRKMKVSNSSSCHQPNQWWRFVMTILGYGFGLLLEYMVHYLACFSYLVHWLLLAVGSRPVFVGFTHRHSFSA
jgi:hypothetical protein